MSQMKSMFSATIAAAAASAMLATAAHAAPIDPGLPGNTSYDGWAGMTQFVYDDYPSPFTDNSTWPGPIGSNLPDSGDAQLSKISGNGAPFITSLYVGNDTNTPNTLRGTFAVNDSTPLDSLATVVFQIQIGEASGYDFPDEVLPVLSFNNGSAISPDAWTVSRVPNGTFTPPVGDPETLYINTWMVQWNLTAITDPITSFNVQWSAVEHAQIYALRLDQSDVYAAIPEPASLALLGMGGLLMMRRQRKVRG